MCCTSRVPNRPGCSRHCAASSMMPMPRVGAGNGEAAPACVLGELNVGYRRLKHVRRGPAALLDADRACLDDGGAAGHHALGPAGAAAGNQLVAVALQQPHAVEWHAEPVAQHLREGRGMALAVVQRAGNDRHRPVHPRTGCRPSPAAAARSPPGTGQCRARAACRPGGSPPGARRSRPSPPRPAHGPERRGSRRCRSASRMGPGRASDRAGCGCGGAGRPGQCPSRRRQRPPGAPYTGCPLGGPRRGRGRTGVVLVNTQRAWASISGVA